MSVLKLVVNNTCNCESISSLCSNRWHKLLHAEIEKVKTKKSKYSLIQIEWSQEFTNFQNEMMKLVNSLLMNETLALLSEPFLNLYFATASLCQTFLNAQSHNQNNNNLIMIEFDTPALLTETVEGSGSTLADLIKTKTKALFIRFRNVTDESLVNLTDDYQDIFSTIHILSLKTEHQELKHVVKLLKAHGRLLLGTESSLINIRNIVQPDYEEFDTKKVNHLIVFLQVSFSLFERKYFIPFIEDGCVIHLHVTQLDSKKGEKQNYMNMKRCLLTYLSVSKWFALFENTPLFLNSEVIGYDYSFSHNGFKSDNKEFHYYTPNIPININFLWNCDTSLIFSRVTFYAHINASSLSHVPRKQKEVKRNVEQRARTIHDNNTNREVSSEPCVNVSELDLALVECDNKKAKNQFQILNACRLVRIHSLSCSNVEFYNLSEMFEKCFVFHSKKLEMIKIETSASNLQRNNFIDLLDCPNFKQVELINPKSNSNIHIGVRQYGKDEDVIEFSVHNNKLKDPPEIKLPWWKKNTGNVVKVLAASAISYAQAAGVSIPVKIVAGGVATYGTLTAGTIAMVTGVAGGSIYSAYKLINYVITDTSVQYPLHIISPPFEFTTPNKTSHRDSSTREKRLSNLQKSIRMGVFAGETLPDTSKYNTRQNKNNLIEYFLEHFDSRKESAFRVIAENILKEFDEKSVEERVFDLKTIFETSSVFKQFEYDLVLNKRVDEFNKYFEQQYKSYVSFVQKFKTQEKAKELLKKYVDKDELLQKPFQEILKCDADFIKWKLSNTREIRKRQFRDYGYDEQRVKGKVLPETSQLSEDMIAYLAAEHPDIDEDVSTILLNIQGKLKTPKIHERQTRQGVHRTVSPDHAKYVKQIKELDPNFWKFVHEKYRTHLNNLKQQLEDLWKQLGGSQDQGLQRKYNDLNKRLQVYLDFISKKQQEDQKQQQQQQQQQSEPEPEPEPEPQTLHEQLQQLLQQLQEQQLQEQQLQEEQYE